MIHFHDISRVYMNRFVCGKPKIICGELRRYILSCGNRSNLIYICAFIEYSTIFTNDKGTSRLIYYVQNSNTQLGMCLICIFSRYFAFFLFIPHLIDEIRFFNFFINYWHPTIVFFGVVESKILRFVGSGSTECLLLNLSYLARFVVRLLLFSKYIVFK